MSGGRFAGIDIGSRSIEFVVVNENGTILCSEQRDTGFDPVREARELVAKHPHDLLMATGYGRSLCEVEFDCPTVTEIKAHATGAHASISGASAILDIGGQDSKAIALYASGKVKKFEMNDRCAAGTGKFLEIMATNLGFPLETFGDAALEAQEEINISSMCTVFAESEVTSLIARGADRKAIARGLHYSVIRRAAGMINRISDSGDIIFTGGVAKNRCMTTLLARHLQRKVLIPENPQAIGALGAALLAMKSTQG
jgi:predicted CoA-substrate-specific enzyme activase